MKTKGNPPLWRKYTSLSAEQTSFLERRSDEEGLSESRYLRKLVQDQMDRDARPKRVELEEACADYVRRRAAELGMTSEFFLEQLIAREKQDQAPTGAELRAALRTAVSSLEKMDEVMARLYPSPSQRAREDEFVR